MSNGQFKCREHIETFSSVVKSSNGVEFIPHEDRTPMVIAINVKAEAEGVEVTSRFIHHYVIRELTRRIHHLRVNPGSIIWRP
jgi:hypothetical protein